MNEMQSFKHLVYLNDEGKKLWGNVFPDGEVPVLFISPDSIDFVDKKNVKIFMVQLSVLTQEQIDKILDKLSDIFKEPKKVIDIKKHELMLRAELTNSQMQ